MILMVYTKRRIRRGAIRKRMLVHLKSNCMHRLGCSCYCNTHLLLLAMDW